MKLLYITNGITGSGGLERVLSIKASKLADDFGYNVHILSLNEHGKLPFYDFSENIVLHSINVEGNPIKYFKEYTSKIKKLLKSVRPDIISVCDDGLKGFIFPILFSKNTPIIYERHASVELNFSSKRLSIFKKKFIHLTMQFFAKRFDAFVVLTKTNKKEWTSSNVRVIPNPISFYPNEVSSLANKLVTAVGTHSFNKGYDLLLQAWINIKLKGYDWHLHIYGKYDHDSRFINMAKEQGLEDSVFFFPPTTNIVNAYQESSIHVLPSRSEGFGMVLIEAMACGVPCVAFDCPNGPSDIISDGEDGYLVEAENIDALANQIINLIKKKELRTKMGCNARENVKRYLPENVVPEWDKLFKELVAQKK